MLLSNLKEVLNTGRFERGRLMVSYTVWTSSSEFFISRFYAVPIKYKIQIFVKMNTTTVGLHFFI